MSSGFMCNRPNMTAPVAAMPPTNVPPARCPLYPGMRGRVPATPAHGKSDYRCLRRPSGGLNPFPKGFKNPKTSYLAFGGGVRAHYGIVLLARAERQVGIPKGMALGRVQSSAQPFGGPPEA
ncbi:hypothetical protein JCM12178A_13020 [Salidesulfovibrio brasiliensis]